MWVHASFQKTNRNVFELVITELLSMTNVQSCSSSKHEARQLRDKNTTFVAVAYLDRKGQMDRELKRSSERLIECK